MIVFVKYRIILEIVEDLMNFDRFLIFGILLEIFDNLMTIMIVNCIDH